MTIYFDTDNGGRATETKDPDARLDYVWDWSEWLAGVGDTISSFTVTTTGGLVAEGLSEAGGVVTAFIRGGSSGSEASATCRVSTAGGRIDDRTLYFKIKEL